MSLLANAEQAIQSLTKKVNSATDVVGCAMPELLVILTNFKRLRTFVMYKLYILVRVL